MLLGAEEKVPDVVHTSFRKNKSYSEKQRQACLSFQFYFSPCVIKRLDLDNLNNLWKCRRGQS